MKKAKKNDLMKCCWKRNYFILKGNIMVMMFMLLGSFAYGKLLNHHFEKFVGNINSQKIKDFLYSTSVCLINFLLSIL